MTAKSEWQSIDTAPKDGTEILSWDGVQRAVIAWSTRDEEWFLCDAADKPEWENPTHWQPLAAKP